MRGSGLLIVESWLLSYQIPELIGAFGPVALFPQMAVPHSPASHVCSRMVLIAVVKQSRMGSFDTAWADCAPEPFRGGQAGPFLTRSHRGVECFRPQHSILPRLHSSLHSNPSPDVFEGSLTLHSSLVLIVSLDFLFW